MENALFVGVRDGAVVRMHLTSLEFDCMLGCGVEHSAAVNALEVDNQYLYSGGKDAVVLVWDLKEANAVREISMPSAPVTSLLRVDAALWVGLENGFVEVFEIFGDDSNGIECISSKQPHSSSVTGLVSVGESEVWSVAAVPLQQPVEEHSTASNVAVWDTRDLSFQMSDIVDANDVMSMTIVDRSPFEQVTVLTLTRSLGPQFISKNVRGSLLSSADDDSKNMELLVSDLEHQLVQANEELHTLRSNSSPGTGNTHARSRSSSQAELSASSDIISPQLSLQPNCPQEYCSVSMVDNAGGEDEAGENEPISDQPVLTRNVSRTLALTLNNLSEQLVSLLAEVVLSSQEDNQANIDKYSKSVAGVTKELNVAKELVESVSSWSSEDAQREENIQLGMSSQTSASIMSPGQRLRRQVDNQAEQVRLLKKDLQVVSKERDLFADDLLQMKSQSESTMSSLEGIIRDRNAEIASKDCLIEGLRKERKEVEQEFINEQSLRQQMEQALEEQTAELLEKARLASKAAEEELSSAYDKLETKCIEVQSQRDSVRAIESQVEGLKHTNHTLDKKCEELQEQLDESIEHAKELAGKVEGREKEYEKEIVGIQESHVAELALLRRSGEEGSEVYEKYQRDTEAVVKELKQKCAHGKGELERREMENEKLKCEVEEIRREHSTKCLEMEDKLHLFQTQFNSEMERWEHKAQERQEAANAEFLSRKEAGVAEIQEKDAKIEDLMIRLNELDSRDGESSAIVELLRVEVEKLGSENKLANEEIGHRKAAARLYEAEIESMRSVICSLKVATEELQESLDGQERESASLQAEVEHVSVLLRARECRIRELEKFLERNKSSGDDDIEDGMNDGGKAAIAILASANGEIEQMSKQIEAMHRCQVAQEKELEALREAVSARDESIRRKNARIERLRGEIEGDGEVDEMIVRAEEGEVFEDENNTGFDNGAQGMRNKKGVDLDIFTNEELLVSGSLQELHEGFMVTQDKVRDLTKTARKYKQQAQCHLDVLLALSELEGELVRVTKEDPLMNVQLTCARGIVQSVIAQYYSNGEKKSVMKEYDESLYVPSPKRLSALQGTIVRMRSNRMGGGGGGSGNGGGAEWTGDTDEERVVSTMCEGKEMLHNEGVHSTQRLLLF